VARQAKNFRTKRTLSSRVKILGSMAALIALACQPRESAPIDSAREPATSKSTLRITILGDPADSRVAPAREAINHWNSEFSRLGLRLEFDSGTVVRAPLPEEALRGASAGKGKPWSWLADSRLRTALSSVPGDIVIALSLTDLISFSVPWRPDRKGVVGMRRADMPPLSLPNTVRNVVAHEIGHVLGLRHNADSTTLMCGRPAPCRPAAFASERAHFFPLTTADEEALQRRWR
jgi:hypothetical protein